MSLFTLYGFCFSHFQKGKKQRICSCVCHRTPERQRAPTLKNGERNDRKGEQEWYPPRECGLFAAQEALFTGCRHIRAKLKGSLSDLKHSLGRVWTCCCDHFYFEAQDQPLSCCRQKTLSWKGKCCRLSWVYHHIKGQQSMVHTWEVRENSLHCNKSFSLIKHWKKQ